ncbi:hypothetical protein CIB84_015882, partial [Bambusicola thoracicus]
PGPVHRLYQVKGRRNIRATERDLSWASFNSGDCFILDLGETIFTWCGAQCNVLERSRAQELAAAIRDGERGSKVRLEVVMDGEEPPEMLQVLGPKPTLAEGSPEEDAAADRNAGMAVLYKARRKGCVGLGMARGPPCSGPVAQQWVRLPKALSNLGHPALPCGYIRDAWTWH